jgi:hypothetical protein
MLGRRTGPATRTFSLPRRYGRTWIASTASKNRLKQKMNMGKAYKQAIKRVFGEKYHDERMAVYWGRDDDSIHVIARLTHYVHKIASENEDTLEFVSSAGDRIIVALTDEERREI